MNPLLELAERRIQESLERGELDDLPGQGRPLALDDDSGVPEHLRAAYRVLKNANCLPPELAEQQEIRRLEDLLAHVHEPQGPEAAAARQRLLVLRLSVERHSGRPLRTVAGYQEQLAERLSGSRE
ncbi:DnaJ family domain-containing protein [Spiribacter halobius]|uniref:DUF1992 domain-containing protein n=1 Tax=Sediminicurvatus halobius TaxID=2182432 RepID=A0A2U2MXY6_9GAMM|nr:DnaJ family domain-containing protein [Spiribacter halobius]PWG61642.1 DUF1992 domain-containing protein [Spiribacter halobius]UEX79460.1 DUF1992 domain-containing protein [Spiribacter halobius]